MKLLAYEVDKRSFLGVLNEDETWVYPVSAAGMEYRSMNDLIREAGPSEMEMLDYISKKMPGDVTGAASVEEIKVVSPIAEPDQDIICLGINYMDHAKESARFKKEEFSKPEKAIYFSKRVNRTNDPDGIIPAHKNLTNQLDYEAELAVIIKKDAKDVKPGEVKDYIFGYTIMNDVSAREVQTEHKQWYFGKSLDEISLHEQLKAAGCEEREKLAFQKALLNGELPYTIGGGIGQSRICMFFLRKAHIGEIQSSLWPDEVREEAKKAGIPLL